MRLARLRAIFMVGVLVWLFSALAPALASDKIFSTPGAASPVSMEVKAGFDGFYKEYAWLPIQVTLALPAGTAAFQGRVEASFSNFASGNPLFQHNVQLAPPARKTVWLYLNGPRVLRQVQVRLVADDGTEVVAPVSKDVSPLGDSSLLLGVISDDTSALNYLNSEAVGKEALAYTPFLFGYNYGGQSATPNLGSQPRVSIAHLTIADLPPEGASWNSMDGLVVSDLNTTFAGDQEGLRNAAATWLSQGAALFVAGDSVLRHAGFLRGFLPVQSSDTPAPPRSISTDKLVEIQRYSQASNPLPAGSLVVADVASAAGSQSVITLEGKPLLANRPFGLGQSWFFASELKPLRNWDGMTAFWKTVFKDFRPRENYATAARRAHDGPYPEYSLRLTPSPQTPELPGPWWLALLLGLYILIIGPVNYLVLKRLDRRELAWITVPALTILFSVGTYAVGNFSSQTDLVMSNLSVVTLGEGNDGRMSGGTSGFVAFYSNGRNDFDVRVADEALSFTVFDGDPSRYNYYNNSSTPILTVQQGAGGGFGRISMGIRAQRSFAFENDGAGVEGIKAKLKVVSGTLEGTVENLSNKDWEDVSLVLPGNLVQKLGTLKAGEKRQVGSNNVAPVQNYLVQTLTGMTNFYQGSNPGSGGRRFPTPYYLNTGARPNDPQAQKAMVLETLFGPNGDGLMNDPGRFYLLGWRNEAQVPINPEGRTVKSYNLTLLFQALNTGQ